MAEENIKAQETEETAETVEDVNTAEEAEKSTEAEAPEGETEETAAESDAGETEETSEEAVEEPKKKKFGKKDKKDPKDEKIEELTDRVKRQLAEFENFRNRTEKEKSSMYEMGAKSVVEKILPVIDNFERGLEHAPEEGDAFADGMRMVYKQMLTELDNIGVKAIEAVGSDFDPNIHNAVMQVESEEYESGKVAQELQKGYMYRDTLVRPSMVAVVQ